MALIIALYIGAILFGVLFGMEVSPAVGLVSASLFATAGLYCLTRVFRGDAEPAGSRRPWWRLTSRPTQGFVWAILFTIQAVVLWTKPTEWGAQGSDIAAVLAAGFAVGMVNSSLRLRSAGAD